MARNIKCGEKGEGEVKSYHRKFYQPAENPPRFNTTSTYDAKAYRTFIEQACPGSIFINVGSDAQIEARVNQLPADWEKTNSSREWGDLSAFEKL